MKWKVTFYKEFEVDGDDVDQAETAAREELKGCTMKDFDMRIRKVPEEQVVTGRMDKTHVVVNGKVRSSQG